MTERRDPEVMFMETAWMLLKNVPEARRPACIAWLGERRATEIREKLDKNKVDLIDINERLEKWKADEPVVTEQEIARARQAALPLDADKKDGGA